MAIQFEPFAITRLDTTLFYIAGVLWLLVALKRKKEGEE